MNNNFLINEALKEHGFVHTSSPDDKDVKVWRLRIHDLMWAVIDDFGFVTLERKPEVGREALHKITLPRPVRTTQELGMIMDFLVLNNNLARKK